MATSSSRRLLATVGVLLLAALVVGTTSGPATASAGYRYWNYFHVKASSYVFAKTGPGDYTPKNNAIEAYRYGTSTTSKGLEPRADLTTYTIGKICGATKVPAGKKRVGFLIDYGTSADAASGEKPPKPRAACAVVPSNANGQQALAAVAQVRVEKFLCGIDGYPVSTCSVTVKNPPATHQSDVTFALPASATKHPTGGSSDSGNSTPLVAGIVVVLLLAGGGVLLARRRSG